MSSKTSYHITDSDSKLFEENLIKKMAKIAHTHTHTAFKDYFFRTPYMCFPHTYHPFLLPTKKNTIYAN